MIAEVKRLIHCLFYVIEGFICVYVMCKHMSAWCLLRPEEGSDSLEVELQFVSCYLVLRTEPRSCERAACAFNR